jgi:hypothetical protein
MAFRTLRFRFHDEPPKAKDESRPTPKERFLVARSVIISTILVLAFSAGCGREARQLSKASARGALKIETLSPAFTSKGKAFNVQPDGSAAIAVVGSGFAPGATILWNAQPLKTSVNDTWVGTLVPGELYARPGTARIEVRNPDGAISNPLVFETYDITGPAPTLTEVFPSGAVAGIPFNVQPDGTSALGVTGAGFLPDAKIYFGNWELKTKFKSPKELTATVQNDYIDSPAGLTVFVRNPDGKTSGGKSFKISVRKP